jgi:LysM repeat protein
MTLTTLLMAGMFALFAFWVIFTLQRNGAEDDLVGVTPGVEGVTDPNAAPLVPTTDRRTEVVFTQDGQQVQIETLLSKDMLTQNEWLIRNQAAPPAELPTAIPELLPTTDPNLAQGQPVVPTIDPALFTPTPGVVVQVTAAVGAPAAATDKVIFKDYTVLQGDSLYSIAEANNSSIELMAKHGVDAHDLVPGTVIRLPYANPAYCPGMRAYVVRDKDTVFRIAKFFSTTVDAIALTNRLDPNYTIFTTDVICIP